MKISGRVVSKKPISVNRASKLISRFAAVENGASPVVALYLDRTSDAFNHLVQFHSKHKNLTTEKDSQKQNPSKIDKKKKKKRKNDQEMKESKKTRALD